MGRDNYFSTQPMGLDAINGLTLAAGVTQSADFIAFYSASAGNVQKALITNIHGGFSAAAGGTGFARLPSGFIIQWFSQAASTTAQFATWPIIFPTGCVAWWGTSTNQTGAGAAVQMTANATGTTFLVSTGTPSIKFVGLGF